MYSVRRPFHAAKFYPRDWYADNFTCHTRGYILCGAAGARAALGSPATRLKSAAGSRGGMQEQTTNTTRAQTARSTQIAHGSRWQQSADRRWRSHVRDREGKRARGCVDRGSDIAARSPGERPTWSRPAAGGWIHSETNRATTGCWRGRSRRVNHQQSSREGRAGSFGRATGGRGQDPDGSPAQDGCVVLRKCLELLGCGPVARLDHSLSHSPGVGSPGRGRDVEDLPMVGEAVVTRARPTLLSARSHVVFLFGDLRRGGYGSFSPHLAQKHQSFRQ